LKTTDGQRKSLKKKGQSTEALPPRRLKPEKERPERGWPARPGLPPKYPHPFKLTPTGLPLEALEKILRFADSVRVERGVNVTLTVQEPPDASTEQLWVWKKVPALAESMVTLVLQSRWAPGIYRQNHIFA